MRTFNDGFVPIPEPSDDDECWECDQEAEGLGTGEVCPNSQRPCQHHCNHADTSDLCHWCGMSWGAEDG